MSTRVIGPFAPTTAESSHVLVPVETRTPIDLVNGSASSLGGTVG
jgi:hypothetical protein